MVNSIPRLGDVGGNLFLFPTLSSLSPPSYRQQESLFQSSSTRSRLNHIHRRWKKKKKEKVMIMGGKEKKNKKRTSDLERALGSSKKNVGGRKKTFELQFLPSSSSFPILFFRAIWGNRCNIFSSPFLGFLLSFVLPFLLLTPRTHKERRRKEGSRRRKNGGFMWLENL